MKTYSIINPARNERDTLVTLCQTCATAGRLVHLKPEEMPASPPAHRCGDCGQSARQCVGCGCTDFAPCEGGCSWISPDLTDGLPVCSTCYQAAMRQAGHQQGVILMP